MRRGRASLTAIIVDHVREDREAVREILAGEEDISIVGTAASGFRAVALVAALLPDLLLLDIGLPDIGGLQVLQQVGDASTRTKTIVFSAGAHPTIIASAFKCGAMGYVSKNEIGRYLVAAIRAGMNGMRFISPTCLEHITQWAGVSGNSSDLDVFERLTRTQRRVVALSAVDLTAAEIAPILTMSVRTVEGHRAQSIERLGLNSLEELAQVARLRGSDTPEISRG